MPADTLNHAIANVADTASTTASPVEDVVADSAASDTAAAGTVAVHEPGPWVPAPFPTEADTTMCPEAEAPWSADEAAVTIKGKVGYYTGYAGVERVPLAGYDSSVMAMVIGVFLIMAFNFRHYSTFLKTFWSNIFTVRRRANAFDDRATVSETRVLLSLVLLLCLGEGIILYNSVNAITHSTQPPFRSICLLSGLALLYYVWQLAAYRITGYVFTTKRRAVSWFKGFTSSQALLGMMLAPIAILLLFMPGHTPVLAGVAASLYLTARLFFIIKGFRIFYHNSLSLIYFILYLCSLEIVPLICVFQIALYSTFQSI